MRLIIDATSLLLTSAGVKNYLHYWILSLQHLMGEDAITLFPFLPPLRDNLDHRASSRFGGRMLRLKLVEILNSPGVRVMDLWPWNANVFHASNHLLKPPTRRIRMTATIYDLTCWLMPGVHQPENVIATKLYAGRVLQAADACIAISESSRQDAIEILRIPPERIRTIYPGVAGAFFNPSCPDPIRRKYRLEKPFLLYVGTVEPRKGVDTLLEAYRRLPSAIRDHCDLVIAGMLGWCAESTRAALLQPELPGIRYLGYVPESDLPALTGGAAAVVFPSVYEGFGFPVAQGMAAGTPVITSRGSSLEEIAGDACLLATPGVVEELSYAMQAVVESPSLQQELSRKGRARAEAFRWQSSAAQTLEFFESVAGQYSCRPRAS